MQITQRPSPNRTAGRQGQTPDFIVLHTTGGTTSSGINTVTNPSSQVSYHFIIGSGGEITQHVNIEDMAWANGTTNGGDERDNRHSTLAAVRERRINANLYSVSIGFGDMPAGNPSPQQMDAVVWLINHIRSEVERMFGYSIPMTRDRIIGHNEVTPIRRPGCPGRNFPFDELLVLLNTPISPISLRPAPTYSQEQVVTIDVLGKVQDINGYIDDGVTYVQLRGMATAMGYAVSWDEGRRIPVVSEGKFAPATSREPLVLTDFEMTALCKMVWAEARGEDELGQRLVVHVIRNRMADPAFPDNLLEVLFQPEQFSPVRNGAFDRAEVDDRIRQRVMRALEERDQAQGATFFRMIEGAEGSWHEGHLREVFDYGVHRFYAR